MRKLIAAISPLLLLWMTACGGGGGSSPQMLPQLPQTDNTASVMDAISKLQAALNYCKTDLFSQVGLIQSLTQGQQQQQPIWQPLIPGVTPAPPPQVAQPFLSGSALGSTTSSAGNAALPSGGQGCGQELVTAMLLAKSAQNANGTNAIYDPAFQQYLRTLISNYILAAGANLPPYYQAVLSAQAYKVLQTQVIPAAGAFGPQLMAAVNGVPVGGAATGGATGTTTGSVPTGVFTSATWDGTTNGGATGSVQGAGNFNYAATTGSLGLGSTGTGSSFSYGSTGNAGTSSSQFNINTGSTNNLGLGLKAPESKGLKLTPGEGKFRGMTLVH